MSNIHAPLPKFKIEKINHAANGIKGISEAMLNDSICPDFDEYIPSTLSRWFCRVLKFALLPFP